MTDRNYESPCVGVCWLDDNDICIGCDRHAIDIFNAGREVKWPTPDLPPVNLNNSLSADDFYSDKGNTDDNDQNSRH